MKGNKMWQIKTIAGEINKITCSLWLFYINHIFCHVY